MKLKITNKTMNKNIDQINPGELFIVVDNEEEKYKLFPGVFMKLDVKFMNFDKNNKINKNAVNLNSGILYYINQNTILQVLNGELII